MHSAQIILSDTIGPITPPNPAYRQHILTFIYQVSHSAISAPITSRPSWKTKAHSPNTEQNIQSIPILPMLFKIGQSKGIQFTLHRKLSVTIWNITWHFYTAPKLKKPTALKASTSRLPKTHDLPLPFPSFLIYWSGSLELARSEYALLDAGVKHN